MAKRKDLFEKWIDEGVAENNLAIIQSMSMRGMRIEDIAGHFGISGRQLYKLQNKHSSVSSVLKKGRETVVAICQDKLMEKVRSGDTAAIIYACKIYGGDFFKGDSIKNTTISVDSDTKTTVQVYIPDNNRD